MQVPAKALEVFLRARQVHLVRRDNLRALGQVAVAHQLVADVLKVLHRIAALAAGDVHDVHKQARALDVAKELDAQAHALARALDDARDIRHDEVHAVLAADAQVRREGREVIIRDLRLRRSHDGEDRALADVRIADQAHVRDGLELQLKLDDVTLLARFGEVGRLAGRRGEVRIAPATLAAGKQHMALAGLVHVRPQAAASCVAHDGAHRHLDDEILSALAAAEHCRAVAAVFGGVLALVAEIHQRVHVHVGKQDDAAAVSAVAAVRAAVLHKLLTMERNRAVAAVAGLRGDFYLIDKHDDSSSISSRH